MIDTSNPACDELFDSVIQSLFGIGLQLENCMEPTGDRRMNETLDSSIHRLHATIAQIRDRGELHCDAAMACRSDV